MSDPRASRRAIVVVMVSLAIGGWLGLVILVALARLAWKALA